MDGILTLQRGATEAVRIDCRHPDWQEFLSRTKHTIFHTPAWQEVVSEAYKAESAIYAYYKEGKIALAFVGFIFNLKLCKVFFASLFDGGAVGDRRLLPQFLDRLPTLLKEDRVDIMRIMQTYSAPLPKMAGFRKIEGSQHIVSLDGVSEDELWSKLYRNRIRKAVQQARYKGVTVKEIKNEEDIRELYKLNRQTIKRNRAFYTFTEGLLLDFYRHFLKKGLGKGWLAQKDNKSIAGLLVVYSEHASHGMVGGSLEEYFSLRANDLLLHEAMVDTIRSHKQYFDFMLSSKNKTNLQFYKDKFGSEEYPACFYEKNISLLRPALWSGVWKAIHTPLGGVLLRTFYRSQENAVSEHATLELACVQQKEWDEFVSLHPHTIFQDSEWAKIMQEGYGSSPKFFILKQSGNPLVGLTGNVLDLRIIKLFFCNYPYGGLVGEAKYADILLEKLEVRLKKDTIDRVRFTEPGDCNGGVFRTYSKSASYQHVLDLNGKTPESLWKDYKSRTRRDVLKAKKSGITVKQIEKEEEVGIYYNLYFSTMKRNRAIGPHPKAFYAALYNGLIRSGKGTILFAMLQGRYIAGAFVIFSLDVAYLLGSVSLNEYLTYCPNDLLIHSAIEESMRKKMSAFDFMTSSENDVRLMQFKEKWGSQKFPFYTYEKNLTLLKPKVWDMAWKMANSRFGTSLIRMFRK